MAIETTGVENVMEEVAHFWQLRKFQFIEEATDFWMDAVAPKECFGDEDPDLRTALTLNQFFTEWLLFEMPYQESTLVGITALRDEISAEQRDVLKQIAETQRFSSFKMQWLNPDISMVQLRDVYSGKCYGSTFRFRRTLIVFSLNIKPQYIPARYFSFCVLLTVLLVTLSIRSLQGKLFITDAQYMVAAGRWIIANGHLPTTDPLSIHSELTYICQQYPICILVAVLYDTFGEMSVRLFFALLDMVAVLFIWYQTFPKAGNRILHCAVSCVFGAVIVYSLRSTPRALDILCLAVSWELMEKYIKSRDIRFLFGFPFLGIFIANLHGALWPCAIMLPLAALLDSKLDSNARIALAVTVLLTIASAMLNPYGLDVLSLPFKTIGTSDVATVAVPELKSMFSIVPVEAVILIVISVVPVIFHAKCLGFKKAVFSFETMMISGLLFLSLMTWRNELLLLGILMIVYSTWCWKLEPKCKVSSKMLSRIVLFSISVVALEFGAVLFYSTLSATDQKSISIERAFQAMREDGAVSGTAVLTDIDPGCRAELNGFKPYLDTRIEVFNGQNGQKNVLAEAGKALSSGSLSAICDDYGMDYAVLNYGINDVGIQDLKESGFKPVYSDNLTVCLKRSTV